MEASRRRWWLRLEALAATLIILVATSDALFQLAISAVPAYRLQIAQAVSQRLHVKVTAGKMRLSWVDGAPALEMTDVSLQPKGEKPARAHLLSLGISVLRLVSGDWRPDRLRVDGLTFHATTGANGLPKLPVGWTKATAGQSSEIASVVDGFRIVRLNDCKLVMRSVDSTEPPQVYEISEFGVERVDGQHRFTWDIQPPRSVADRVSGALNLNGPLMQPDLWSGTWNLDLSDLRSLPWLDYAIGRDTAIGFANSRIGLEGKIEAGKVNQVRLVANVGVASARRAGKPLAIARDVQVVAQVDGSASGWRLRLDGLSMLGQRGRWSTSGAVQWAPRVNGGVDLDADLRKLRLDDIGPWFALWPATAVVFQHVDKPQGELSAIRLRYASSSDSTPSWTLAATMNDIGWQGDDVAPGVQDVSGQLTVGSDGGKLLFEGAAPVLIMPTWFKEPVRFTALGGELDWKHESQGWQVAMGNLTWSLPHVQGQGGFNLTLPSDAETPPDLHLQLTWSADQIRALAPFLPLTWEKATRQWIESAVRSGSVTAGSVKFDGPLNLHSTSVASTSGKSTPVTSPHWSATLKVDNADLKFSSEWPALTRIKGNLRFADDAMNASVERASYDRIPVKSVQANIADFHKPVLTLQAHLAGDASAYYQALRDTPLKQDMSGLLDDTKAKGATSLTLNLSIPLHEPVHVQASGAVAFQQASMQVTGLEEPFSGLTGSLSFDGDRLSAKSLQGQWYGLPVQATINPPATSANNQTVNPQSASVLQVELTAPPGADVGPAAAFLPGWIRHNLAGNSHWVASLPLRGAGARQLTLTSNLLGVISTLPAPLTKSAAQRLPTTVTIGMYSPLSVRVDIKPPGADPISIATRFSEVKGVHHIASIGVRVGQGPEPLAKQDGIDIYGQTRQLDVRGVLALIDLLPSGLGGEHLPLNGVDLQAASLRYGEWVIPGAHLEVSSNTSGNSQLMLSGDGVKGRIAWLSATDQLKAQLDYLHLQHVVKSASTASMPSGPGQRLPLHPTQVPTLQLDCAALTVGKVNLGWITLKTDRIDGGQRLSTLKISGGEVDANAHGTWTRKQGASSASADFSVDIHHIGDLLDAMGFVRSVTAANAHFAGTLTWPSLDQGLDLALAQGEISMDVKSGSLRAVDPGAGRVLGLLNLYALPRRLLFNFGDVVGKGLAFDRITGSFDLGAGQAVTHDVRIAGPSVHMTINGRIGLAARDFDETVTVYPDLSAGVTLGAALLGGPIAGGIALLAQQLVGKALNSIISLTYRVTGPWSNPQVLSVSEEPAPRAKPPVAQSPVTKPTRSSPIKSKAKAPTQPSSPQTASPPS